MSTYDFLAWSIEGRARSQAAALRILTLIRENRRTAEEFPNEVDDLVAATFSLWRAVFLADMTDDKSAKLSHAELFLTKMLSDNSITFAQDFNSREWAFHYYADNAFYRLHSLVGRGWGIGEVFPEFIAGPKARWDYFQRKLETAIDFFEQAVGL